MPSDDQLHSGTPPADVQATWCATLVDQWVLDGLSHAVVAPGSRSTPMALALAARRDIELHVFHDERSAAFAALGIGLATGRPAVLLCTSGTAATHFHGTVAEADLSCVPMLVLTADRPPELVDVGAAQTIGQTRLYGTAVRWFHDPGVAAVEASRSWRPLARQAWSAATGVHPGPVHLNLPFREPLVGTALEPVRSHLGTPVMEAVQPRWGALSMLLERERGVIVAGRGVDDPAAVAALGAATGWPVLADPRSGCRGLPGVVASADAILRHQDFADAHVPEVVLHLGEPPASKVLAQWLAAAGGVQVRVHATRAVIDPSHVVSHRLVASPAEVCRRLAAELRGATGTSWTEHWQRAARQADEAIGAALAGQHLLTEPAVARELTRFDGTVVVASSMPIRDIEWFGDPAQRATVVSNRGANGIDGTVATATGVALATRRPVAVLLGDVALLHDQSSLTALSSRGVDVRIVVVDNDGGGIFSFLPQASTVDPARFERLFGTPHGTDLAALGAAHHLDVHPAVTLDELRAALLRPGPSLTRVPSDRSTNVAVHAGLHAAAVAAIR